MTIPLERAIIDALRAFTKMCDAATDWFRRN